MFEPRGGWAWSAIGIGTGGFWLAEAGALGPIAALPLVAIGVLLLSSGVSTLLWPGDRRATEIASLAGLAGVLLAIPYAVALGFFSALVLSLSAAAAFWAAGRTALHLEPHHGVRIRHIDVSRPTAPPADDRDDRHHDPAEDEPTDGFHPRTITPAGSLRGPCSKRDALTTGATPRWR